MAKDIVIKGANENNLKNLNVTIQETNLSYLLGFQDQANLRWLSTQYMQRGREDIWKSLSSYARQFLGQMEKPDVEYIEGLSPAISIDQKTTNRNPRSTVGTVTEIHDYFRLLYARVGKPHCPVCGKLITSQSVDQMVDTIMERKKAPNC